MKTWELAFMEVAPPGREPQVRALKSKPGVDNPYAVAWASYNDEEGGPGSGKRGHTTPQTPRRGMAGYKKPLSRAGKNPKTMPAGYGASKLVYGFQKQAASSGGLPQTLRGRKTEGYRCSDKTLLKLLLRESVSSKTYRFSESALMEVVAPVQSAAGAAPEGPMVSCWLITEGLGNRADMHYYGPEAIEGGAPLFEGQPCFIDHQTKGETQERPERTVRDKCGYFRNVRVDRDSNGRLGLCAELHYDLSETGRYAYDKACTAIHYKTEFPDSDKEYVGLSIAADGKLEERTMKVGDEILDVKYVTEFTQVGSVDEVTSPARGGRFVAVLAR